MGIEDNFLSYNADLGLLVSEFCFGRSASTSAGESNKIPNPGPANPCAAAKHGERDKIP